MVGLQTCGKGVPFQRFQFQLNRTDLLLHGDNVCLGQFYFFIDVTAAYHVLMLGEIAQSLSFGQDDFPAVCGEFADNHLEQRGLSGAVWPYEGGFFVVFYMK